MSASLNANAVRTGTPRLDLTSPPRLDPEATERLSRLLVPSTHIQAVRSLTEEETPRRRTPHLIEVFRKLDASDAVELLKVAGQLSLRHDPAGLRLLFGFLEVKRPGAEVLSRIGRFQSLGRVALRSVRGAWPEPESAVEEEAVFQILDVFEEATRLGVLDLGLEKLPREPRALQSLVRHIGVWFRGMTGRLEAGRKLGDPEMSFVTQISMLEINLAERRLARLASAVDPYDSRGIGRLMPLVSYWDQEIEHLKSVVSRLATYRPFYERLLTMDNALSAGEMERIQQKLLRDPVGSVVGWILKGMRTHPILDRQFSFLVSLAHQIALLRSRALDDEAPPDLLSVMFGVLETAGGRHLEIAVEPEVAESIWPVVNTWNVVEWNPRGFSVGLDDERGGDFVCADGTPRLPEEPRERKPIELSLKDLVLTEIHNDAFLIGVLENPRAVMLPGLVPAIATHCRSVRVLDRIIGTRALHSGPVNAEVPRLILQNPARTPVTLLNPFINVRFVNRIDLERLARPNSPVRPEVRQEVLAYLKQLRTS